MYEPQFLLTLENMEMSLETLQKRVPAPKPTPFKDSFVFRYQEKTIHQALIQKLARMISGLHAANLLNKNGFFQEQASLQRILDELQEDITFLTYAIIFDDITELHTMYLEAFYEEEFDNPENPLASTQKRPSYPRKKIRAYLAKIEQNALDPSRTTELARTLHKTYSGFIHCASPQIMDMYGGNPPRFHVSGMRVQQRFEEYHDDLWNYFYRGIIAFGFVAKAFGQEPLFQSILQYRTHFEEKSGKQFDPSEII